MFILLLFINLKKLMNTEQEYFPSEIMCENIFRQTSTDKHK